MKKVLVFTATYNEADNIASLVDEVFAALPGCDMLVVDDNSPDGTGGLLEELKARHPRLHAIHRPGKNGLGTAHKIAIKYALAHGYDALITMDADFSHDPRYLPEMMRQLADAEFVIGSRFAPGGSCQYPLSRLLLSRGANTLTRALLRMPVREATTSYRGFRRSLLERMNVDAIRADGYSFFVESIYQVSRVAHANGVGRGMAEFPIRFVDRRAGSTKISKKEIFRGFTTLARLAVGRAIGGRAPVPPPKPDAEYIVPCNACGSTFHVEQYPATNGGAPGPGASTYSCTSVEHGSHGRIVHCLGCGLVYTNPQLPQQDVLSFYSQVEDKTYLDNIDARVRTFTYNLDAIDALIPKGGRMLELGSYCGVFLKIARERGHDVLGVEPSDWASNYARETLGIPTITGSIQDLPPDTKAFDTICAWDVLEHLSDPLEELGRINARLRPGGVFAFSTLDYGNWYPQLMGERWPWMMDMHLYYFNQKVLSQMLARAGFKVVDSRSYRHIITFEYFLHKLAALGVPGAEAARAAVAKTPLRGIYIPFHFGDIRLFVCEKVGEADAAVSPAAPAPSARDLRPEPGVAVR